MVMLVDGLSGSLQSLPNAYKQDSHWKSSYCFPECCCVVSCGVVEYFLAFTIDTIKLVILTLSL